MIFVMANTISEWGPVGTSASTNTSKFSNKATWCSATVVCQLPSWWYPTCFNCFMIVAPTKDVIITLSCRFELHLYFTTVHKASVLSKGDLRMYNYRLHMRLDHCRALGSNLLQHALHAAARLILCKIRVGLRTTTAAISANQLRF